MRRMVFVLVLLLIAPVSNAKKTYCTTNNWTTASNYYVKYENRLNDAIDKFNVEVDQKNAFEFFYTEYSVDQISELWNTEQNVITAALNYQHKSVSEHIQHLTELRKEFVKLKGKFISSKRLWQKIGDSCNDDGKFDNGRLASKNFTSADSSFDSVKHIISRIDRFRDTYRKDLNLLEQGSKRYRESVVKSTK